MILTLSTYFLCIFAYQFQIGKIDAIADVVKRSDDVNPLEVTVLRQAAAIQTLQADLVSMQNRLQKIEQVKQVLFRVYYSPDIVDNVGSILRFDNVVFNIGGGYDKDAGIFTAPITGVYTFFVHLMAPIDREDIHLVLMHGNDTLDYIRVNGKRDNFDRDTGAAVVHLSSGEKVWVQYHWGDRAVQGALYTQFF